MKAKKLIRKNIVEKLKADEWEYVTDQNELNELYALKVQEELNEIQESEHKDVKEFADLIQVVISFAEQNGFSETILSRALTMKAVDKGTFSNIVLNNLNPNNPSNALYFKQETSLNDTLQKIQDNIEEQRGLEEEDYDFNEGLNWSQSVINAYKE